MYTVNYPGITPKTNKLIDFGIRNIYRLILLFAIASLTGCGGGGGGSSDPDVTQQGATDLVGSVGDGPITGATITVKDANGALVGSTQSDATASYKISVPGGTSFPVTISAIGGTDIVTGTSPDFTMVTVALKKADLNSKKRTVNINPFSTFIVHMAQSMPDGLNTQNVAAAKQIIYDKFNFGLDATSISDPISTDITNANIADIVKASEALGELIRRTRDAMVSSGISTDGNAIIAALASDLADGAWDDVGNSSNSIISATSKVASAQVLVELIRNKLKVNNAVATPLLDNAILVAKPGSTKTTSDVVITGNVLTQTRTALAAAERYAPSTELTVLSTTVTGLSNTATISDIDAVIPNDAEMILSTIINSVPTASTQELEAINSDDENTTEPQNIAPTITSSAVLDAEVGVPYTYDVNASDENGALLTYELTTAPAGMSISGNSGVISWTPTTTQVGAQEVTVRVTDNGAPALSASQGFTIAVSAVDVNPDNVAPVITSNPVLTAQEGLMYNYDSNATDANEGNTLNYQLVTAPAGMSINATSGMLSWVPTGSQVGTQDVTIRVSDNGSPALTASQSFTIAVAAANVAPEFTSNPVLTAKQGSVYSYDVNASDSNTGDSFTFTLSTAPVGMNINAATGLIGWTPTATQVGRQDVTVRVTDNGTPALSTSQSFTVVVAADTGTAIRVNAGGGDYVDASNRLWEADYGYNLGDTSSRTDAINGTTDDTLYQTERWHPDWQNSTSPELEYRFNVPSGDYAVIVHFAEITQYVNRVFDIEVEGQVAVDNLDIVSEVGRYNVLTKTIKAAVNDGEINIRFNRDTQSPKVSAIEILPLANQTTASTSDSNPVVVTAPEASSSTGTLSIIGQPSFGTAVISGDSITYTANTNFEGQDTIAYSFIDSNGSVTVSIITVNVTCNSCAQEVTIELSWQPNTEAVSGYLIYYGPDSMNATELITDVTTNSGLIDPSAPSMVYQATSDLNYYPGEQVCFKIKAYMDNTESALSDAVCGTI